jgi:hypothetical protein
MQKASAFHPNTAIGEAPPETIATTKNPAILPTKGFPFQGLITRFPGEAAGATNVCRRTLPFFSY